MTRDLQENNEGMSEIHKCPNCGQNIYVLKGTEDVYPCDVCMKVYIEGEGKLELVGKEDEKKDG